ncbi:MAG: hypothetical protein EA420_08985 [Candidatus Competibacteraceae bacterium]|nr:MAG: hypothetical protein EA420_08985 [Candidatus Competibacteraceae bacterium]
MNTLDFDTYTRLTGPLLDYNRSWARNYLWLYRASVSSALPRIEEHPALNALAAIEHTETFRHFHARRGPSAARQAPRQAKQALLRTLLETWKRLDAPTRAQATEALRQEHRDIFDRYIIPSVHDLANAQVSPLTVVTKKILTPRFREGAPGDREAPLANQIRKAGLIFARFLPLKDGLDEGATPIGSPHSAGPSDQSIRRANQQIVAWLIDVAYRAVGFGEITDAKFLATLGYEILLVALLSHWRELDPDGMERDRNRLAQHAQNRTLNAYAGEDSLLGPAVLFFTRTTKEIARGNHTDLSHHRIAADLSMVRQSTAEAIAGAIDRLAEQSERLASDPSHPAHRVFPSLFSKACHRARGLDEPIDTHQPAILEDFKDRILDDLEWSKSAVDDPRLAARLRQVERGYQSFSLYGASPHPRLGRTGGRLYPRSWLASATTEGSHPRFFLWGADFHQQACAAACAVQGVDPDRPPPLPNDSPDRDPLSLPVCFLTQRYLSSESGDLLFTLSRVEMDQYASALSRGKRFHSEPVAHCRAIAERLHLAHQRRTTLIDHLIPLFAHGGIINSNGEWR